MKISKVINLAIEESLWNGTESDFGKSTFSCGAVSYLGENNHEINTATTQEFLQELGWHSDSRNEFHEFPYGEKRQYARAIALTWAALMAEEEGL